MIPTRKTEMGLFIVKFGISNNDPPLQSRNEII